MCHTERAAYGRRQKPKSKFDQRTLCVPETTVTGWVDDVRPFVSSHTLYLFPFESAEGLGSRRMGSDGDGKGYSFDKCRR